MEEEKSKIVSLMKQVYDTTNDLEIIYQLKDEMENFGDAGEYNDKLDEFRKLKTGLTLEVLKIIREKKDLNFDFDIKLYRNIAPEGPYPSGIAPEAIKEEDIRKKYKAAIAENKANIKKYNYERTLLEEEKDLTSYFRMFTAYIYARPPYRDEELKNYFQQYNIDEDLRRKIFKSIKEQRGEIHAP
ncbi:MAG: hypothetical protein R3F23_02805 [Verrucomicrobiia bacterium]